MKHQKQDINHSCPYCGGTEIVKNAYRYNRASKTQQVLLCKSCKRKFSVASNSIRIVAISDLHCGHENGMVDEQRLDHANNFQKELFGWFVSQISKIKPIDLVIANGDLIDGRQDKSGGSELIVSDRLIQAEMAANIINMFGSNKVYIARGTPYHTGKLEEFENLTARLCNAEYIGEEIRLLVNQTLIYARHKIGNSSLPYSYFTAPARNLMFDSVKNSHKENPKNIDIALYAHVHRFSQSINGYGQTAITMPAMQGYSKYGARECDGIGINLGFLVIDIEENGKYSVTKKEAYLKTMIPNTIIY